MAVKLLLVFLVFTLAFCEGSTKEEELENAAMIGDVGLVETLLEDPNVNPSAQNNLALNTAIVFRQFDVVSILLKDSRTIVPNWQIEKIIKFFADKVDEMRDRCD